MHYNRPGETNGFHPGLKYQAAAHDVQAGYSIWVANIALLQIVWYEGTCKIDRYNKGPRKEGLPYQFHKLCNSCNSRLENEQILREKE